MTVLIAVIEIRLGLHARRILLFTATTGQPTLAGSIPPRGEQHVRDEAELKGSNVPTFLIFVTTFFQTISVPVKSRRPSQYVQFHAANARINSFWLSFMG